ncbi:MAG: acyltransferase family protein [Angustibacter sp.]
MSAPSDVRQDATAAGSPTAPPRRPLITALTGLRAVAALWVVLFHYRSDVLTLAPALRPLAPVMSAGYLGVDVFFALSGFVLAYNYAASMGHWDSRATRGFWRNRIARVWPVHVVTLHLDLLQAAVIGTLGITAGGHRRTVSAYVENLTMTHAWWNDRPSFNAPAWSISAEWAAYLAAPVLFVALARLRRRATAALLAAGLYAVMLTIFALWALQNGNVPHAGMLRLATEFGAGALMWRVYRSRPQWLGRLTLPLAAALALVVLLVPGARHGYWLAPALGLLVLCLALDAGPLARLLSSRPFVFWGEASYSLYMTHVLLAPSLHALLPVHLYDRAGWPQRTLVLAAYAGLLGLAAVAMHRGVEVPARRLLRARRPAASPADSRESVA